MLDWNDLRYFLAVARSGSTLAAAKLLGVNQSTVARRIAAFESQLGCRAFERRQSGYRLTELGAELVPCAERAEEGAVSLQRRAAAHDTRLRGTLRFTCPEGLGYRLLAPLLDTFHAKYPELSVSLILTDRFLDLAKGEADVAVRGGEPRDGALVGRKLADLPWAVFGSRDYVERHGRPHSSSDLDRHRIIALDGDIADIQAARWLRSVAPNATVTARSNSVLGCLAAVKSGVGLATLPVHIGDLEDTLVRVLDPLPELMSQIWLLTHPDLRHTPRLEAFFDFIVTEIRAYRPLLLGQARQTGRGA